MALPRGVGPFDEGYDTPFICPQSNGRVIIAT
jgi:hypothetical protein